MDKSIETYYTLGLTSIKDNLTYKTDFFLSLIFKLSATLIMIFVWTAVFVSSGSATIGGYSLTVLYVYFFIVNAVIMMIDDEVAENMQNDIRNGTITTRLVRPVNYAIQLFFSSVTETLLYSAIVAIPLLVIASIIIKINIAPIFLVLFIAQIVVGYLIVNVMGFLIGTLAIYFTDIWGIISVTWSIIALLSGALIPLNLYPQQVLQALLLTPFPILAYMPSVTLLGLVSMQQIINSLVVGIVWLAFLTLFATLWWKRCRKDITSVGG